MANPNYSVPPTNYNRTHFDVTWSPRLSWTHFKELQDKAGTVIGKKAAWEKHTANYLNQILYFHKRKCAEKTVILQARLATKLNSLSARPMPNCLTSEELSWLQSRTLLRNGSDYRNFGRVKCERLKRTGKPAHNNAVERSAEDEPEWEADPSCQKCGGSGEIWTVGRSYTHDGEAEPEWVNEPCECMFARWVMKPSPT